MSDSQGSKLGRSWRFYALLSVSAAVVTIALKAGAYLLTGSVGLLSDAAESLVNLAGALGAFWALSAASRPPDEEHAYGHTKAEYFASAFEGALVLVAAGGIVYAAVGRLIEPQPIENVSIGLAVSAVAALINGGVGLVLIRAGGHLRSSALRADGRHLLTDVWTSVGVVAGVLLVALTGWLVLDPLIALVVAANIVRIGVRLMNEAAHGLLDTALPPEEQAVVERVQRSHEREGLRFHATRTRVAGSRRFVSMHVLVPGGWSVQRAHDLSEEIERQITEELFETAVFVHVEPLEDPASWRDRKLDRSFGEEGTNRERD